MHECLFVQQQKLSISQIKNAHATETGADPTHLTVYDMIVDLRILL